MNYRDILRTQLSTDEGYRESAYQDSLGYWTIGIGHLIDGRKGGKLSRDVILLIFAEDVFHAEAGAHRLLPNFDDLSDKRKAVVINMVFQLGEDGLGAFHNTLLAIQEGRWDDAADAMLSSKVAQEQTPERWLRHAQNMREG